MTEHIDEIVKSIGKIVVNFNGLEMTVRRLIWAMIDSNNQEKGHAVTKLLDAHQLVELGQRLRKAIPMTAEQSNTLKATFTRFSKVKDDRNNQAHQMLRVPNDAMYLSHLDQAWPQHYKKGVAYSSGNVKLEELHRINQECIDLMDEFEKLLTNWNIQGKPER